MKYFAFFLLSLSCSPLLAQAEWKDSTVVKISTTNEWCRHCPDWNQTSYWFKLDDGTVYVAQTHKKLDVTLNGHTKFRFEKDGHVGDRVHILDDAGKDQELHITEKMAAEKRSE